MPNMDDLRARAGGALQSAGEWLSGNNGNSGNQNSPPNNGGPQSAAPVPVPLPTSNPLSAVGNGGYPQPSGGGARVIFNGRRAHHVQSGGGGGGNGRSRAVTVFTIEEDTVRHQNRPVREVNPEDRSSGTFLGMSTRTWTVGGVLTAVLVILVIVVGVLRGLHFLGD